MHFPPKIRQILPPCDNCDIKNGRKQVKKFGQHWLILTVQYLVLSGAILSACRAKELPISLTLFLLFPDEDQLRTGGEKRKSEFTLSVKTIEIAEKMKRCVPLRRNVAEKPRGMRLKFVLSQLRTCTHESKNRFVFFKSLKFYCEQESVESNPVKLNGVSFNLVPRSHSGRGRSGYEIRGRLKRAL